MHGENVLAECGEVILLGERQHGRTVVHGQVALQTAFAELLEVTQLIEMCDGHQIGELARLHAVQGATVQVGEQHAEDVRWRVRNVDLPARALEHAAAEHDPEGTTARRQDVAVRVDRTAGLRCGRRRRGVGELGGQRVGLLVLREEKDHVAQLRLIQQTQEVSAQCRGLLQLEVALVELVEAGTVHVLAAEQIEAAVAHGQRVVVPRREAGRRQRGSSARPPGERVKVEGVHVVQTEHLVAAAAHVQHTFVHGGAHTPDDGTREGPIARAQTSSAAHRGPAGQRAC
mmetsp:Transcript_37245/g.93526  ORF Transcript_37245/g.93526 Transcript_37245/m.93526 type:complete len:287 (+) Transcript_37245:2394-3254(+)